MNRQWILILVLSLLGCETLTCWLHQTGTPFAEFESAYRIFHLLQMITLILVTWLAYKSLPREQPWKAAVILVFTGLCFSLAGDVINSFLIDLSFIIQPQTLLSAIPFAIAHFLYIGSFWIISRSGEQRVSSQWMAATFLVWPLLAFGLWQVLVDSSAGPVLKWLSFAYAHMVVLMALTSLWPLKALGKVAWVAAAGGFIFLLSDSIFGAWLAEGQDRPLWVSQAIWTTYFLAQLAIAHVPLINENTND